VRLRGPLVDEERVGEALQRRLGLVVGEAQPDCQPEYFVAFVPRPTGSSRHSYWVSSFTRGSL
jgi:hypothetical protein